LGVRRGLVGEVAGASRRRLRAAPPFSCRAESSDPLASDTTFHYRSGEVHCEGVPAARIADAHGTPCYVYSGAMLRGRYERIRDAFGQWEPTVCFSVKSCGNLSILRLLAQAGSGFDVVSGGELYRALTAGADPGKIVFAGVGKGADEIEYALRSGILMFNVESRDELVQINSVAGRLGVRAVVALRINPDVDPHTHEKTATGKGNTKFGISVGQAEVLAREAADWDGIEVRGLHLHLGSPVHDPQPYAMALAKVVALAERLRGAGCTLDHVNIGGGYAVSYTGAQVTQPEEYAATVRPYLENLDCAVIIEPGRYMAGNSAVLLTRVLYRKETALGKRFVICDAAMTDLIRPTLYGSFQRIWPACSERGMPEVIEPDDREIADFSTEVVDVVGGVCETGDFLARDCPLPRVRQGDLLAVFDAGAYGFSMSSNYNARPRAAEVLVEGPTFRLIRRRETYDDLIAPEKGLL